MGLDKRPVVYLRIDDNTLFSPFAKYLETLGCQVAACLPGMSEAHAEPIANAAGLILWVASTTYGSVEDDVLERIIIGGKPVIPVFFGTTERRMPWFLADRRRLDILHGDLDENTSTRSQLTAAIQFFLRVAKPSQSRVIPDVEQAYFHSFQIEQYRCFRSGQHLELSDSGSHHKWNVILGDNGTGKTTLLRLLAGFSGANWNGWQSGSVPGRCAASILRWQDFLPTELDFAKRGEGLGPICIGYGAWRGTRDARLQYAHTDELCRSLMDEEWDLANPEEWLLQADYTAHVSKNRAQIDRAIGLITSGLLPDVQEIVFEPINGKMAVMAETRHGKVPLRDLSYGYRSSLSWVMDLAGRMFDLFPNAEDPFAEPIVVLVDEIDLHLHPKWQKQLLKTLDETFTKAQFIVTAHSPLIVQAAPNANLALLKWKDGEVIIDNDLDYVRNWRVDQILASELFEEQPVHSPDVEKTLERRRELLLKDDRSPEEAAELVLLNDEVDQLPTASLPQDQEAMDLIREVAKRLRNEGVTR